MNNTSKNCERLASAVMEDLSTDQVLSMTFMYLYELYKTDSEAFQREIDERELDFDD